MAEQRFTAKAYHDRLLNVRLDLRHWQEVYRQAAEATTNGWISDRFQQREARLGEAVRALDQALDQLADFPRTS